jgi:hypothetical protein
MWFNGKKEGVFLSFFVICRDIYVVFEKKLLVVGD